MLPKPRLRCALCASPGHAQPVISELVWKGRTARCERCGLAETYSRSGIADLWISLWERERGRARRPLGAVIVLRVIDEGSG